MVKSGKLETLLAIEPVRFFRDNSINIPNNVFAEDVMGKTHNEVKLFSSDRYDETTMGLADKFKGKEHVFMLSHAGGGDAVLSLYANLAAKAKGPAQLLVVDRKQANIQNFLFRLALSMINTSRFDYLQDMFGIVSTRQNKAGMEAFLSGDPAGLATALKNPYDSVRHGNQVADKIFDKKSLVLPDSRDFYLQAVRDIAKYIHGHQFYEQFVKGVFSNILQNGSAHYLSRDFLFERLRESSLGLEPNKKHRKTNTSHSIHFLKMDISTPEDLAAVESLISKYVNTGEGIRPVSIALLQHIDQSDAVLPFLGEKADQIVTRYERGREKFLVSQDSSGLTYTANTIPGLIRFKEQLKTRSPIKDIGKAELAEGLELTMLMPHLEIGNAYVDEMMREDLLDIARQRGVSFVVTSNAVAGPMVYRHKALRKLKDPDYSTLDSQLKKFKEVRSGLPDANWVYVPGQNDKTICEDLKVLYIKQQSEEQGKKQNPGFTIPHREEAFMTEHEEAERIIKNYVWPYMLRIGRDPTFFTAEIGRQETKGEARITELVNGFRRYDQGALLTERDREIIDWNMVRNNPSFAFFSDYSGITHRVTGDPALAKKEKQRNIRVMGNTKFSGIEEYKAPVDTMEQIAAWAASGILEEQVPEGIIVDSQQVFGISKINYDRFIAASGSLVDDRRKFDADFAPGLKNEVSSRTQKRISQHKRINVPSSLLIDGDPRTRMHIEIYNPTVIKKIRERQGANLEQDVNIMVIHDTQIGSLTERLNLAVKEMDYGAFVKGCTHVIGIGDRGQFRNYPGMPNENAILGGITVQNMQQVIVELSRPYFRLPQIKSWSEVAGNHEWNTDKLQQGHHLLEPLRQAIIEHVSATGHDLKYQFPSAGLLRLKNGDIVQSNYGMIDISGYKIAFGHMFAASSMSKDSKGLVTSQASRFITQLGDMFSDVDLTFNGHNHHWEILNDLGRIHCMFSCRAGESGFELDRQYYAEPRVGYVTLQKNGIIRIETLSESELMKHEVMHPEISRIGLDRFVYNATAVPLQDCFGGKGQETKKYYRRPLEILPVPKF